LDHCSIQEAKLNWLAHTLTYLSVIYLANLLSGHPLENRSEHVGS
jgi:hypothetical protein